MLKSLLSYITQSQHTSYPLTPNTALSTIYKQSTLQFCLELHLNSLHRTSCLRDVPDNCSSSKIWQDYRTACRIHYRKKPLQLTGKNIYFQTSPSLVYTYHVCIKYLSCQLHCVYKWSCTENLRQKHILYKIFQSEKCSSNKNEYLCRTNQVIHSHQ